MRDREAGTPSTPEPILSCPCPNLIASSPHPKTWDASRFNTNTRRPPTRPRAVAHSLFSSPPSFFYLCAMCPPLSSSSRLWKHHTTHSCHRRLHRSWDSHPTTPLRRWIQEWSRLDMVVFCFPPLAPQGSRRVDRASQTTFALEPVTSTSWARGYSTGRGMI